MRTPAALARRAAELVKRIRAEWAKLGSPLTTEGLDGKVVVTHPLVPCA